MTNIELQALRRIFMLSTAEAAENIGHVSVTQWQAWEQGTQEIPSDIILKMNTLSGERHSKVTRIINDINNRIGSNTIKYFMNFADFKKVNPTLGVIHWRLHQSIASELYLRGLETLC